ncbi:hypothetical protein [Mycetohabitans sp. B5]|nr:hypothetical protein [Mycetohabitans sp. B5]
MHAVSHRHLTAVMIRCACPMIGTGSGTAPPGVEMNRNDLLKWIRNDGSAIVKQYLPNSASVTLDELLVGRRHEVDMNRFLMFYAVRALLQQHGMGPFESDRETGRIMALLDA